MTQVDHKNAILAALREQVTPISLPELIVKSGRYLPARTVRRWLTEWVASGLVIRTGINRGARYLAVKGQDHAPDSDSVFSQESIHVIQQIKRPYSLRRPISYHHDWLKNYRPNKDVILGAAISDELYLVGKRAKNHEPAGTYAKHIYQRLLIDLSYNSSRLEGNTFSLLETKELIVNGVDIPGKLDEEKTMILNHKEAIRYLVERPGIVDVNETTILTLHYLLSDGLVAPQYSGKVRDHGVRISGSVYIPLENHRELERNLKNICDKAADIENPYEQSIFLLAHLAYLQAFIDVNKRTSRLAANISLINHNLVPLSFNDVSQDDYTNAMIAIYELNNLNPLIDLYKHSYLRTAALYDATVESIGFDRLRVQYRQQRREIIRHIIIHGLKGKHLESYINEKVNDLVAAEEQSHLVKNIYDDLSQLGPQTIVGLGVSIEQVKEWLALK